MVSKWTSNCIQVSEPFLLYIVDVNDDKTLGNFSFPRLSMGMSFVLQNFSDSWSSAQTLVT